MRKTRAVVWTPTARRTLKEHVAFIKKISPSGAVRVRKEILLTTRFLATDAEMYQLDEYRLDLNSNIRRFFRWHYKVVFEILTDKVVILKVLHTSQNPTE